jgi:hypothetical protein
MEYNAHGPENEILFFSKPLQRSKMISNGFIWIESTRPLLKRLIIRSWFSSRFGGKDMEANQIFAAETYIQELGGVEFSIL